jgi:hypothetical protein
MPAVKTPEIPNLTNWETTSCDCRENKWHLNCPTQLSFSRFCLHMNMFFIDMSLREGCLNRKVSFSLHLEKDA